MGHGVDRPSDLAIRPLKSQKPALAKGSLGSNPVIRTRLRVKPQPMPANVRQLIARHCKRQIIGSHWPAMAGSGAGDGNRKYRSRATNHLKSGCYEIVRSAACDSCVENGACTGQRQPTLSLSTNTASASVLLRNATMCYGPRHENPHHHAARAS